MTFKAKKGKGKTMKKFGGHWTWQFVPGLLVCFGALYVIGPIRYATTWIGNDGHVRNFKSN